MVEREEITGGESAKVWLETQDRRTQAWFYVRSGLRGLPALGTWNEATASNYSFRTCRALLIAAAITTSSARQMKQLSDAAAEANLHSHHSGHEDSPEGSAELSLYYVFDNIDEAEAANSAGNLAFDAVAVVNAKLRKWREFQYSRFLPFGVLHERHSEGETTTEAARSEITAVNFDVRVC